MKRRDFMPLAGMSGGAMVLPLPAFSRAVDPAGMLKPLLDEKDKKVLAEAGLAPFPRPKL